MKTTRLLVAALGVLVGLAASNLFAQMQPTRTMQPTAQPVAQMAAPQIAVIDISRIFKEHPRFIEAMAQLKARVEEEDAKMKGRADNLQAMADQLKAYKAGSPEYKSIETKIASDRAQMQVDIQVQRKEFLMQEAAIYREIYEGVKAEVANYASQLGLAAVIRYASQPPEADPEQPNNVLTEIQKDLVWFNSRLDITSQILANLKARSGSQPAGRPGIPQPQYPAQRPGVPQNPYR